MNDILKSVTYRNSATPQTKPTDSRQIRNAAGGYTFAVSPLERFRRFLLLGTEGGTYYVNAKDLTKDNAEFIIKAASARDGMHRAMVDTLVELSLRGAAPRQNATLFSLAVLCSLGSDEERSYALGKLPVVARTGTHLFQFADYVKEFRGWGPSLRKAVARWYTEKDPQRLGYQVIKYRAREGYTHRDLLRLSHPSTSNDALNAVLRWIVDQGKDAAEQRTLPAVLPPVVRHFMQVQAATTVRDVLNVLRDSRCQLPWEALPDFALSDPKVWNQLLATDAVPYIALMRQLPRLTRIGAIGPLGAGVSRQVRAILRDKDTISRSRVHPINILIAHRTYMSGQGKGSSWTPLAEIGNALEDAFYLAFGNVEPTGKRTMLALDVSGSMTQSISGLPLSCRDASAALALVQMAVEREGDTYVVGFTSAGNRWFSTKPAKNEVYPGLSVLTISPQGGLAAAIKEVSDLPFGGTDAALPIAYAHRAGIVVDTFVVATDNETWSGGQHVHEALRDYRRHVNRNAKLVVVGMTATENSIADPDDAGSLNVVGFDAALPRLIADFSRAEITRPGEEF